MPMYVFKCEQCDHEVTELRKMDDDTPPKSCPECDGKNMKKQVTSAYFRIDPAAG